MQTLAKLRLVARLILTLSLAAVAPWSMAGEDAADTCILRLNVPQGATVTVGGRDYGQQRTLTFRKLEPGQRYLSQVQVRLADGSEQTRSVYVQGGQEIHLPVKMAPELPAPMVPQTGPGGGLNYAAFSPDGRWLLTSTYSTGATLWDVATGRQLRHFPYPPGVTCSPGALALDPAGRYLAFASSDNAVALWDVVTGEKVRSFWGHGDQVAAVAFSPDGRQLLSGAHDHKVILWDTATGEQLRAFDGHTGGVGRAVFAPDGKRCATSCWDNLVIIWDVATGRRLRNVPHHDSVQSLSFSPDGRRLLSTSWQYDGNTGENTSGWALWDVSSGAQVHRWKHQGKGRLNCILFASDGKHLYGSMQETGKPGRVIVWDVATGKQLRSFEAHRFGILAMTLTPDGKQLLTASVREFTCWDCATEKPVRTFGPPFRFWGWAATAPDGKSILTYHDTLHLWELNSGTVLQTFPREAPSVGAFLSSDGRRVVFRLRDHEEEKAWITVWDAQSAKKLNTVRDVPFPIQFMAISADGTRAVTCTDDRQGPTPIVWDLTTGRKIQTLRGFTKAIFPLAMSPDGRRVLAAGSGPKATLWDAETGQKLREFDHPEWVNALAFSPDGRRISVGYGYGEKAGLTLWEADTGRRLHVLKGHQDGVSAFAYAFSPDGQLLLSGSADRTAILWDPRTGKRLRRFQGHTDRVNYVGFVGPEGRRVFTGSGDGTLRLWDVATGDELVRIARTRDGKEWLAVTPEGLIDGSEAALEHVMFRIGSGLDVRPLPGVAAQLRRPGLLADIAQGQRPLPQVDPSADQAPRVRIVSHELADKTAGDKVTLEVEVADAGGGSQGPWISRNGNRLPETPTTANAGRYVFQVPLEVGANRLEVHAASADGRWHSEPAVLLLRRGGQPGPGTAPTLEAQRPQLVLQTGHSDAINFARLSPDGRVMVTGSEDTTAVLWDVETGQQMHTLRGHNGEVACAAFSPDGRQLVTGAVDYAAMLWDVASGRRVRTFGVNSFMDALAFTPDGRQIVAAAAKTVYFWEVATGRTLRKIAAEQEINDMALSPDGRLLLTAMNDEKSPHAILWNAQSGQKLRVLSGHKKEVTDVTFSPDSRQAITTSWTGETSIVWDAASGRRLGGLEASDFIMDSTFTPDGRMVLSACDEKAVFWDPADGRALRSLQGQSGIVRVVAISPDATRLLTYTDDEEPAIVWDTATGRWLYTYEEEEEIERATFSPDGGRLLYAAGEELVLRDAESGKPLLRFRVRDSYPYASDVAFSPDGRRILAALQEDGAAIYDAANGRKLLQLAASKHVHSAAFSPDGRLVLTGGGEPEESPGHLILWDAATAKAVETFGGWKEPVRSVAFSPDGRRVLSASGKQGQSRVILWDVSTGKALRTLQANQELIKTVAFSPDGQRLYALDDEGEEAVAMWDADSGQKIRTFRHWLGLESMAVCSDGRHLVTGRLGEAILWDAAEGLGLRAYTSHTDSIQSVSFTPDGKRVLTGGESPEDMAILWEAATGRQLRGFRSRAKPVRIVAFCPDGRKLLTTGEGYGYNAILWDLAAGQKARVFGPHPAEIEAARFSPDGRELVVVAGDKMALHWDVATGRELRSYRAGDAAISDACFTPDGRQVVTVGGEGEQVIFWDAATGRRLRSLTGHSQLINTVAVSPDQRRLITGSADKTAIVWDLATGAKLHVLKDALDYEPTLVDFSHDGRRFLVSDGFQTVLCNSETGAKLRSFKSYGPVCLSPDDRLLLAVYENRASLYDTATGETLKVLVGHTADLTSVGFSPDGRLVVTGAMDGTARLWDTKTGDELAHLTVIDGGAEWVVTTPDGLFDGSPGGRQVVAWRVPGRNRPVPVDRFFQDFFRPGLLREVWGGGRPEAEVTIGQSLPPRLRIVSPKPGTVDSPRVKVVVEAIDQGGGVAQTSAFHNGARILAPGTSSRSGNTVRRTFEIALIEGENRLRFTAASADGSWEAEPVELVLRYEEPLEKSRLHVLAIGINRYADASLNLNYAATDARAFAELFQKRGDELYAHVHVTELLDQQATRTAITEALKQVAGQTRPQDTLIVFMAGHGAMVGQRYYYVTHEMRKRAERLEDDIRKQGLPADEISDFLGSAQALKRILILDTCASGGALGVTLRGRSGFALRGAVERLSRSQGVYTIAASAATEEAQESKELGHGVLSYTLLAALKAVDEGPLAGKYVRPSGPQRVVDAMEWITFAAGHVPRLTEKLYGVSQDVQYSIQGQSFPVLPLDE